MDLRLLQVFQAIHASGNVSRAADQLGLSQPAVSHALRRLREQFRDPLFLRVPGGVTPTARAERLAAGVADALQTLEAAVREHEAFDPAASTRTFRLYMTDIGEFMFLPGLMQALHGRAPGLRLEVRQLDPAAIEPALADGRLDLAVGYLPQLAGALRHCLLRERYVLLLRAGHPLRVEQAPATPADLRGLEYVVVRSHEATRKRLQGLGLLGNVRLDLPHFMVIPAILARTDLGALVPYRLASLFCRQGGLQVLELAADEAPLDVCLHWMRRADADAGNRWLRGVLLELFQEPVGDPAR